VLQDAADYAAYVEKAAATSPDFKSGDDVAGALKAGDAYDPQQLVRGEIAYAAVAALQDPTFVASLRTFGADTTARGHVAAELRSDPNYVTAIAGADSAAEMVVPALLDRGQKLMDTGAAVKQAAYAIQHQSWSLATVANRDQRLADAKIGAFSAAPAGDVGKLQAATTGASPLVLARKPAAVPLPRVVVRGLAVAALAALGDAGDDQLELMAPLFQDKPASDCLNMAKLNLYQCLAVARPYYEDVFCLGEHTLADTGQCLTISAGAAPPVVAPLPVSSTETAYDAKPAKKATTKRRKHKPAS
jgi:hypothetical protein